MSLVSFSDNFGQISFNKNINYCGGILTNLNNTMQTEQHEQHEMENRTHIQIERIFTRNYFCSGRIFSRRCSKSSILINSINCGQYVFISRDTAFLVS